MNYQAGNHTHSVRSVIGFATFFALGLTLFCRPNAAVAQGISFPNFSTTAGLNLSGSAGRYINRLRLTPSSGWQAGSAWFANKQAVANGFVTTFQFQISQLDRIPGEQYNWIEPGGDGFAFVIQNSDARALGDSGGHMGYDPIPNSLAIEFDTWYNPQLGDPNNNHISVHTRGTSPNSQDEQFSLGWTTSIPKLKDGTTHTVVIAYFPHRLKVYIDGTFLPVLDVDVDLSSILALDNGRAWVGFTAGTGASWENHDIHNWLLSTLLPVGVDIDERRGYGLLSGDATIFKALGTPPLYATITPRSDLKLWLGISSVHDANGALVVPTDDTPAQFFLTRYGLMAPSATPRWNAQFPFVGSEVTVYVNMTLLAAELNILDVLLTAVGAPITTDDIAGDLDNIVHLLDQLGPLGKAASRFIPLPQSKAAFLRAAAAAAFDLRELKDAQYTVLAKIVEHASHGEYTLNIAALKKLIGGVSVLKNLIESIADVFTLAIQTKGDTMSVTFIGSPIRH